VNHGLYILRDTVAEQGLGPIMQFKHDAVAVRSFREIVAMKESQVGKHPEDFELVRVGSYDDETFKVAPENPQVVVTGKALIAVGGPDVL
jgi:hypothetical protein